MVLVKILIAYILSVIYTRWMNKFLYERIDDMAIIPYAWFVPIMGPIAITVAFFTEYGETFSENLKTKFKFSKGFSGENWEKRKK